MSIEAPVISNQPDENINLIEDSQEVKPGQSTQENIAKIDKLTDDIYDESISDDNFTERYGASRAELTENLEEQNKQIEMASLQREFLFFNPTAEVVDADRGIYSISTEGGEKLYGSIYSIIDGHSDLERMSKVADSIRSGSGESVMAIRSEEGATYTSAMVASGSFAQREINPFPADMDFAEHVDISVEDLESGGRVLASILQETVSKTSSDDSLKFLELKVGVYPEDAPDGIKGKGIKWTADEIKSGRKDITTEDGTIIGSIDLAKACENPSMVKLDWLAQVDGQVKELTKVINVEISDSKGEILVTNRQRGSGFQEIYFDDISKFSLTEDLRDPKVRKEYLDFLRKDIKHYSDPDAPNFLKVAKRAYNFLKVSGDIDGSRSLAPLFSSSASELASRSESLGLLGEYLESEDQSFSLDSVPESIDQIIELVSLVSPEELDTELITSLSELKTVFATDKRASIDIIKQIVPRLVSKVNGASEVFLRNNQSFQDLITMVGNN